jgi:hypothetical protein
MIGGKPKGDERMRSIAVAVLGLALLAPAVAAAKTVECHTHRAQVVHFRTATTKDVLEVVIGPGPCHLATLSIVIKADADGEVFYSYVAPLMRHIPSAPDSPGFLESVKQFVDRTYTEAMSTTAKLPPFTNANKFRDDNGEELQIPPAEYERLRWTVRPVFGHANHYEGWQYVVFDEKRGEGIVIIRGGV